MTERWSTQEEILAALARFEAAIPGYERPAAWAIGRATDDGTALFERVNVGERHLPAVVLATVCGHVSGSGSYFLSAGELSHAIALLAPAEAWTDSDHPNLVAWRDVRAGMTDDDMAIVVFAGDLGAPADDPGVRALLDLLSLNHS